MAQQKNQPSSPQQMDAPRPSSPLEMIRSAIGIGNQSTSLVEQTERNLKHRVINTLGDDEDDDFQIQVVDFSDESEGDEEQTEELLEKVDRRATLLAETLHTIIKMRKTSSSTRIQQSQVSPTISKGGLAKNNPFARNHSSTDLFKLGAQQQYSARGPQDISVGIQQVVTVDEIKSRLLQKASCRSSEPPDKSAVSKLSKPVVHESIFIYVADKNNGGMALAEKWNLTLEQTKNPRTGARRKSFMSGVNPTPDDKTLSQLEENKTDIATSQTLEIDENYFQRDSKQVLRTQISDMTDKTTKLCMQLPVHTFTSISDLQADIRWEKTKDWRSNRRQESETITLHLGDVGKMFLNAEFVTQNELRQHLKQDQREQIQAQHPMRRASFFGLGALAGNPGLGALGLQDTIPEKRARGYSDQTPELCNSLLLGSTTKNQINEKFKSNLLAHLGANDASQQTPMSSARNKDSNPDVPQESERKITHKTSGESSGSSVTGRIFGKIAGLWGGGGSGRGEKDSGRELGEELPEQQRSKNELGNSTSSPHNFTPQSQRARVTSAIEGALGSPTGLPDSSRGIIQGRERFYSSGNPFIKKVEVEDLDMSRRQQNQPSQFQQQLLAQMGAQHQCNNNNCKNIESQHNSLTPSKTQMNCSNAEQMMLRGTGTVLELNSNSSPSTNQDHASPQRPADSADQDELVVTRRRGHNVQDDEDNSVTGSLQANFGHLMQSQKELANSISTKGGLTTISTRSGNDEERTSNFSHLLQRAKILAQAQLKEQEKVQGDMQIQSMSMVDMSQEKRGDHLVSWTKQEFVNVLKVRRAIQNTLS